jgi:peptidoglycan/xylan/chitin deacetylase (PgdA/CDA1 family)
MIVALANRARPRVVACRTRPRRHELSLSFDDGPSEWTPSLLDALARYSARATFFVLGEAVQGREAVLQRAVAEGHELGNHTFSHRDSTELTDQDLRDDLIRAGEEIRAAVGFLPRLARPPYMVDPARFARVASALGFRPTVLASVDARDWDEPTPAPIVARVLAGARPGAIVDLHDGIPMRSRRAHRDRSPTVEAMEQLLPELRDRAFDLVTVSELLA